MASTGQKQVKQHERGIITTDENGNEVLITTGHSFWYQGKKFKVPSITYGVEPKRVGRIRDVRTVR